MADVVMEEAKPEVKAPAAEAPLPPDVVRPVSVRAGNAHG